MQGEVEEAYEMLGSLDNALKAFTGRFGLEEVLYTVHTPLLKDHYRVN